MTAQGGRVLVADPISDDGVDELRRHFDVDVHTGQTSDELLDRIGYYEAMVVRSETKVRAEHIAAAGRMRVIGRAGGGGGKHDEEAGSRARLPVVNPPGVNPNA